jgi:peptidyl-prolyl cis-trans isomerase A (cyclophilin A)
MRHLLPAFLVSIALCAGCDGGSSGSGTGGDGGSGASGGTAGTAGTGGTATGGTGGTAACGDDVTPPNEVLPDATDPEQGNFTLDEALAELPEGPGPLRAIIDTDLGTLTCTMHPDEAPIGVANFLGLARGRRAFRDPTTNEWVRRPYYDGLTFHRVIPDFVAQGGDPLGTGFGGPGYEFPNEVAGLTHVAGTLAYANAGPDTNGSQFYICEKPQPQLDADYTIFGECEPVSVVTEITHVPTDANDKPLTPVTINKITVTRCAP